MRKVLSTLVAVSFLLLMATAYAQEKVVVIPLNSSSASGSTYTGEDPVNVDNETYTIGLNPSTNAGDLITWDGNNWVATQPAVKSVVHDNMQPWLGINYIIALTGHFPSRNSIADPTYAEIVMFAGNFAPRSWAFL